MEMTSQSANIAHKLNGSQALGSSVVAPMLRRPAQPLVDASGQRGLVNFGAINSLNPMVSAALPFFEQLQQPRAKLDATALKAQLLTSLHTFDENLQQAHYPDSSRVAARHVLCAWADDLLLAQDHPALASLWSADALVITQNEQTWGKQPFFRILERSYERAGSHLDLLELMYLCLSFGFEGKYRHQPRGHIELSALKERLYRCIRQHRGDYDHRLMPPLETTTPRPAKRSRWGIFLLCAALLCFVGYASLTHQLQQQASALANCLNSA